MVGEIKRSAKWGREECDGQGKTTVVRSTVLVPPLRTACSAGIAATEASRCRRLVASGPQCERVRHCAHAGSARARWPGSWNWFQGMAAKRQSGLLCCLLRCLLRALPAEQQQFGPCC